MPRLKPAALAAVFVLAGGASVLLVQQMPPAQAQEGQRGERPTGVISSDRMDATAGRSPLATSPFDNAPVVMQSVSLEQAQRVVAAAKAKAEELGIDQNVAVVDAGANLKAFERMDGAWLGSVDIAIKKAKTARMFDMPTGDIGELSQPGKSLYMIEVSNGGLITFPGGVPLKDAQGTIIGAVGVSGSSVENDHACAVAGAEALR